MTISKDQIIFISGCGHSGTTVLLAIVDSHPKIYAIKRETNWFNNYQCVDSVIKQEYDFEKNKPETLFYKKEILAEKTPNHIFSVPVINRFFPNSQHIFIIRNPLDVCASLYKRYNDLDRAIDRWNNANHFVLSNLITESAWLIKYENLVNDSVTELQKLCSFLNLDYCDSMLNFYQNNIVIEVNDAIMQKRNTQIKQKLSDHNNNYKDTLSDNQVAYVLEQTRKLRQVFGY